MDVGQHGFGAPLTHAQTPGPRPQRYTQWLLPSDFAGGTDLTGGTDALADAFGTRVDHLYTLLVMACGSEALVIVLSPRLHAWLALHGITSANFVMPMYTYSPCPSDWRVSVVNKPELDRLKTGGLVRWMP